MDLSKINDKFKKIIFGKRFKKIVVGILIVLFLSFWGGICLETGYEHGFEAGEAESFERIAFLERDIESLEMSLAEYENNTFESEAEEYDEVSYEPIVTDEMVWIVDTNNAYAYHGEDCRYVQRDDVISIPRYEAENMGRTPCKRCGGY